MVAQGQVMGWLMVNSHVLSGVLREGATHIIILSHKGRPVMQNSDRLDTRLQNRKSEIDLASCSD